MKIKGGFRIRVDLDGYIAWFEDPEFDLELSEVAAFITECLQEEITRDDLVEAVQARYLDVEEDEVDEAIRIYAQAGILEGVT